MLPEQRERYERGDDVGTQLGGVDLVYEDALLAGELLHDDSRAPIDTLGKGSRHAVLARPSTTADDPQSRKIDLPTKRVPGA
jgi:hypothetical protein